MTGKVSAINLSLAGPVVIRATNPLPHCSSLRVHFQLVEKTLSVDVEWVLEIRQRLACFPPTAQTGMQILLITYDGYNAFACVTATNLLWTDAHILNMSHAAQHTNPRDPNLVLKT